MHAGELLCLLSSAPPQVAITVGASPFTYTAPNPGRVVIQGGTVSLIELGRNGAFVTTGIIVGVIPVSRDDQIRVTYTVLPTLTFFSQ